MIRSFGTQLLGAILVMSLLLACSETEDPLSTDPIAPPAGPSLTAEWELYPVLAEAEAATLPSLTQITMSEVSMWGMHHAPWFQLVTEATTPHGPWGLMYPHLRHDAYAQWGADSFATDHQWFTGDYVFTLGALVDSYDLGDPDCTGGADTYNYWVSSQHQAQWRYFLTGWLPGPFGQWLAIDKGPNSDNDDAYIDCNPNGGHQQPGGTYQPEGECQLCQQWFWVENGVIVDEWWECTPIDPMICQEYEV